MNNYILAIASSDSSNFYFVLWKWDLEVVRDNPDIFPVKLPKTANENTKMRLSFSTASMENDQFSLVSKDFIIFYLITEKGFEETERIELSEQSDTYGSELYGHTWLFEGSFCFITDEYINILDGKYKQLIQQMENPDGELKIISPYTISSSFEGFIAAGVNKKMQFYVKKTGDFDNEAGEEEKINKEQKTENYSMYFEKTKFDFVPGLNEKIVADKLPQNDKGTSNDRQFDFHSIVTFFDEEFAIATTSNNDLIYIDTNQKEIDRKPVRHLISPFHSDSIEGMDTCINKPYLITCSKDKTVRLWDYAARNHVISKSFEEELYSITYHPSGMHALVSTDDKIFPLNVFYDEIDSMTQPITTKAKSKDIKFSNMGHLFAFDSGTFVQIWDFLNMQLYSGPPPYGQQKKSFSTTTSKINYLSWNEDDKNLLACGHEYIYDWKVKEDHDTKYNDLERLHRFASHRGRHILHDKILLPEAHHFNLRIFFMDQLYDIQDGKDFDPLLLGGLLRRKMIQCLILDSCTDCRICTFHRHDIHDPDLWIVADAVTFRFHIYGLTLFFHTVSPV